MPAQTPWYVMQVESGREQQMVNLARRVVDSVLLEEVFFPRYETEIKLRGKFVSIERPLIPGYVVLATRRPWEVGRSLKRVPKFSHVLTMGGEYVPLGKPERVLMSSFTRVGDRVVPMSTAVREGETVVIVDGPLVGLEGLVREVNRHKSTAYLELDLCGRKVPARVGLAVLSSPDEARAKVARKRREGGV